MANFIEEAFIEQQCLDYIIYSPRENISMLLRLNPGFKNKESLAKLGVVPNSVQWEARAVGTILDQYDDETLRWMGSSNSIYHELLNKIYDLTFETDDTVYGGDAILPNFRDVVILNSGDVVGIKIGDEIKYFLCCSIGWEEVEDFVKENNNQ